MRLLNTGTLRIMHFPNPDTRPPYAILSHVWQGDEASYQDIHALRTHADPLSAAPEKVRRFCAFARGEGYEWVWLDTCCIDKTSSSELSEALNSMFRWYQDAVVCYAYLHDVPDLITNTPTGLDDDDDDDNDMERSFVQSAWFTRGWTLQELLAPRLLFFVSSEWTLIGTKHSWTPTIHRATGIDQEVLTLSRPLHKVSLARRMSWAARRRTTCPEDHAYSLMGIFDVNMVTLYGEGAEKAFHRLQEKILRHCPPDQSLFAWGAFNLYDVLSIQTFRPRSNDAFEHEHRHDSARVGCLLAPSPDCFAGAGNIIPVSQARVAEFLGTQLPSHSVETHITGFGVRVTLPLIPVHKHPDVAFFAVLACQHSNLPESLFCLYLGRSTNAGTSQLYPVGAFTPALPRDMCPANEQPAARKLHRSRGGFLCHSLPPATQRSVIIPTIYLVHNPRKPGQNTSPPHGRAFGRAMRMYDIATRSAPVRRLSPGALSTHFRTVHHGPTVALPRRMPIVNGPETYHSFATLLNQVAYAYLHRPVILTESANHTLRPTGVLDLSFEKGASLWLCYMGIGRRTMGKVLAQLRKRSTASRGRRDISFKLTSGNPEVILSLSTLYQTSHSVLLSMDASVRLYLEPDDEYLVQKYATRWPLYWTRTPAYTT